MVKNFEFFTILKRILQIGLPANLRALYIFSSCVSIISFIFPFLNAWLIGLIITALTQGIQTTHPTYFFTLLATSALLLIANPIIGRLWRAIGREIDLRVQENFDELKFRQRHALGHVVVEIPDLLDLFRKTIDNQSRFMASINRLDLIARAVLSFIITSWVIVYYEPALWFLLILFTIPEIYIAKNEGRKGHNIYSAQSPSRREYENLREMTMASTSVREQNLTQTSNLFINKTISFMRDFNTETIALFRERSMYYSLAVLLSQGALAFILIYFVFQASAGIIEIGALTFIFFNLQSNQKSLSDLFNLTSLQLEDNLYIKDIIKYFDSKPLVSDSEKPVILEKDKTPRIELKNVSFTYPSSSMKVLKNISLIIEPGTKLGIVGLNGAGKTTFTKLLCRLYDPTSGEIFYDGVPLKSLKLSSLYNSIGVLFQDFAKYNMNLRENVASLQNTKTKDDKKIISALNMAGMKDDLKKWPDGLDQFIGKFKINGVELSGGQWQKLALAKLFYRDPRIFILDEPTANIDPESEEHIFNELAKLPKDKTVIMISHRYSTLSNADRIIVIKDGRVSEDGTHEALLKQKGDYAKLYTIQAKRFTDS